MKRRFVILICPWFPPEWSMRDLLQKALCAAATDLGFEARTTVPELDEQNHDDVYVALETRAIPEGPPRGTVLLYNLEPLPMPEYLSREHVSVVFRQSYEIIRNSLKESGGSVDGILDYCESTTRFLLEQGHRAVFCPPGFHESIVVKDAVPFRQGVYVLGKNRPGCRRARAAKRFNAQYVYTRNSVKARERLSVTPGVHVCLQRERDVLTFGGMKMIQMYLANKRFVISEPYWWSPLNSGEHYLEVPAERIPDFVTYYYYNSREADEIALNGFKYIKRSLHMTNWLKRALEVLRVL